MVNMTNEQYEFFSRPAPLVARDLIGWRLYVGSQDGEAGGVITETEAYTQDDAASHSYRGRTPRTDVMFGRAGRIYVYFTYGMHWCMNIVTGKEGSGEAVLIRSLEPEKGIRLIRLRRHNAAAHQLTNGPAKICQALAVSGLDNGVLIGEGRFQVESPTVVYSVRATQRIGITKDVDRPWRFVATN